MAYVQVPKDLTRVKTKIMFNLTKRQLIGFGLAVAVGVPFYLLTRKPLGPTISASFMVILVLPFFFFAMYEKDGRPLEKILMNMIRQKMKYPVIRPYRTNNMYRVIQNEIYEKEVLGIGETKGRDTGKKKQTGSNKRKNKRQK